MNSNFVHIEKCTPEQLRKAFSKLPKAKLIDMLVECNRIIDTIEPKIEYYNIEEIEALYSCDCIVPGVCTYMSKERFVTIVSELINK